MPPCWIDLEGAANVRDLGGLPAAGGGRVAPGRLLRSANLQGLTDADMHRLTGELGLRTVVDLRSSEELELEGPGPLRRDARVEHHHHSLMPEAGEHTDVEAQDGATLLARLGGASADAPIPGRRPAGELYLRYLDHRPDSVVGALRALRQTTVIVHCAAGKDRTGVIVALALATAGVPRPQIVEDYVATGERIEEVFARLKASPTYAPDLAGHNAADHHPQPETLHEWFALLDERHGGPHAWLEAHGYGAGEQAALRVALLED